MDWLTQTLYWYLHLLLIGIIFMPLTKRIFHRFIDHGYAFSKTVGIIAISYTAFISGIIKIPFTQLTLYIILAAFASLNLYIFMKDKERGAFINARLSRQLMFVIEELIFLGGLIFLAYVRGQEPSVRGLEKFMDFGFMNSILKSVQFPPLDMWYSAGPDINGIDNAKGYSINYYYFGHLTGAMLIKFVNLSPFIGYNLVLATILAQSAAATFSLIANIIQIAQRTISKHLEKAVPVFTIPAYIFGILGSYILNFGGNLHTIYLFTKGYTNETPVPFWDIVSSFNPMKYWYPNATRFIPFTIHEFPSYSYVVADLHGHVFDIPFVLLTLALLFHTYYDFFFKDSKSKAKVEKEQSMHSFKSVVQFIKTVTISPKGLLTVLLGFMCAVHYMTNAFDGPIYLLLSMLILFIMYKFSYTFIIHLALLFMSYIVFSFPFTAFFSLFVSGVGVNCPPNQLFSLLSPESTTFKLGPFLFEKGNCQKSPLWMMFILWGFFWVNAIILLVIKATESKSFQELKKFGLILFRNTHAKGSKNLNILPSDLNYLDLFMGLLFLFGTFLIIIPEFFYVKDIYPAHFRANTMFKLGYQSFMMMSIASTYVIYRVKLLSSGHSVISKVFAAIIFLIYIVIFQYSPKTMEGPAPKYPLELLLFIPLITLSLLAFLFRKEKKTVISLTLIYITVNLLTLIIVYPFFSFPSYYSSLQKSNQQKVHTSLKGEEWLRTSYPEDLEIIEYINKEIKGQHVILEAQGDSYTDYGRVSSYTGNPTIAGWWVHEWLWRGSSDVVGKRLGDITNIYESKDIALTRLLLKKYHVEYIVITPQEKKKYPNLYEEKFMQLGTKIFTSTNGFGALYQVK